MDDVKIGILELIHQVAIDTVFRGERIRVVVNGIADRFRARHIRAACRKQRHRMSALLKLFTEKTRMHFQAAGIGFADCMLEVGNDTDFHIVDAWHTSWTVR